MNPFRKKIISSVNECNDMKTAIQNAFINLYDEKNFYDITVRKLCSRVPIARTTFYNYYDNIDQLLEEIEDILIYDLIKFNDKFMDENCFEEDIEIFEGTLSYIMKNKKIFYIMLIKHHNARFIEKWKNSIKYHFYEALCNENNRQDINLILEIVACSAIGVYTYWLQNEEEVAVNDINKVIIKAIKAVKS